MRALERDIAIQRIKMLFSYAQREYLKDPDLAREYIRLALGIAKRLRVKVPRECKHMYCKKCHSPLIPGVSSRVRLRPNRFSHISITCLNCGWIKRIPLRLKYNLNETPPHKRFE
ncbi:MAG: ribonuclease P [Thermoprotei archaeon]|nr:MAG: ribonuclease P [Thermoprotei archaeon]RLE82076.1 MAG: ribonuclease P [Thermoprotei archaeon]RLF02536.1 MAG: ribonuclease P [Thermoprotei archaeon]